MRAATYDRGVAKAWEVPGLDGRDSYRRSAGRVVGVRAREMFSYREGVTDVSDIERLHSMRVASRRLRAAMEIFAPCFPRKPFRRTLDDVKMLAHVLGARRDRDVQLAGLKRLIEAVPPPERPGLERLAERFRGEQAAANRALEQELKRAEESGLERRLAELARLAVAEAELAEAEERLRLAERVQAAALRAGGASPAPPAGPPAPEPPTKPAAPEPPTKPSAQKPSAPEPPAPVAKPLTPATTPSRE